MARRTRSVVVAEALLAMPFMTRDTVAIETPACWATVAMETPAGWRGVGGGLVMTDGLALGGRRQ